MGSQFVLNAEVILGKVQLIMKVWNYRIPVLYSFSIENTFLIEPHPKCIQDKISSTNSFSESWKEPMFSTAPVIQACLKTIVYLSADSALYQRWHTVLRCPSWVSRRCKHVVGAKKTIFQLRYIQIQRAQRASKWTVSLIPAYLN